MKNRQGQTLVESVAALSLLIWIFFCVYYTFLIGISKIRSLDAVYHLARYKQVEPASDFGSKAFFVVLQCFGVHPYRTRVASRGNEGPRISEVTFTYFQDFGLSFLSSHKSLMRVAMPNTDFLNKSYPNARFDTGSGSIVAETAEVELRAHQGSDTFTDPIDDAIADRQGEPS